LHQATGSGGRSRTPERGRTGGEGGSNGRNGGGSGGGGSGGGNEVGSRGAGRAVGEGEEKGVCKELAATIVGHYQVSLYRTDIHSCTHVSASDRPATARTRAAWTPTRSGTCRPRYSFPESPQMQACPNPK
jgi:hypothetical protein